MNSNDQLNMFYSVQQKRSNVTNMILEMLQKSEITKVDIQKLIQKRPEVYGHLQGIVNIL